MNTTTDTDELPAVRTADTARALSGEQKEAIYGRSQRDVFGSPGGTTDHHTRNATEQCPKTPT